MLERTIQGALDAAAAGQIDNWVDQFLRSGLGANPVMAAGLRLQPRWWIGPILLPIDSLLRLCGPEPEMQYRQGLEAWDAHVTAIMTVDPDPLPPLILEYRGRDVPLGMHDGSHRHEALRRLGKSHVWTLIWCNSEADFDEARPRYTTIPAPAR